MQNVLVASAGLYTVLVWLDLRLEGVSGSTSVTSNVGKCSRTSRKSKIKRSKNVENLQISSSWAKL